MNEINRGDRVSIIGGPFEGKTGVVDRIGPDSVTVVVEIFDRRSPVQIAVSDLAPPPER